MIILNNNNITAMNYANNKHVLKRIKNDKIYFKDYYKNNLLLYFDGINNTGNGHDPNTIIWKDLSNNGNDGILKSFLYNETSGWFNNGLKFKKGAYGTVQSNQINPNKVTCEIIFSIREITSGEQSIVGNWQYGGYGLLIGSGSQNLECAVYINGAYRYLYYTINLNEKIHVSFTYDGNNMILYINGVELLRNTFIGQIGLPQSNTILSLGCNPSGSNEIACNLNGEIYAVRLYDIALTDKQLYHNFLVDKKRYNLE